MWVDYLKNESRDVSFKIRKASRVWEMRELWEWNVWEWNFNLNIYFFIIYLIFVIVKTIESFATIWDGV